METRMKLFGTVIALIAAGVSSQDCPVDVVLECLRPMLPVYQNISDNLQTGDIRLDYLADTCSSYFAYRRCMPSDCPPPFPGVATLLQDTFSYVCDDNFRDVESYRSCWENRLLRDAYLECGVKADLAASDAGDPCRFYEVIEGCADDVTFEFCGDDAAFLVLNYLSRANNQQKRDLQCIQEQTTLLPQTTFNFRDTVETAPSIPFTTQPPPNPFPSNAIRCWDCHSGMSWNQHKNCPVNGDVNTRLLTSIKCSDACFTRTDRWNKESVYRGCSAGHWLPQVENRTGCWEDKDNGVVWCFCSEDKCNTKDMSEFLEEPA